MDNAHRGRVEADAGLCDEVRLVSLFLNRVRQYQRRVPNGSFWGGKVKRKNYPHRLRPNFRAEPSSSRCEAYQGAAGEARVIYARWSIGLIHFDDASIMFIVWLTMIAADLFLKLTVDTGFVHGLTIERIAGGTVPELNCV